jgi:HTH-type transcriptional regulator / antitoxin HigA
MKNIRPIKTEAQYREAMARIGKLMDVEVEGKKADELRLLAILVERYEDERFPIGKPTPIEAARFRKEQR